MPLARSAEDLQLTDDLGERPSLTCIIVDDSRVVAKSLEKLALCHPVASPFFSQHLHEGEEDGVCVCVCV